jgi:tetratricopeptide (TPR) repeat protein
LRAGPYAELALLAALVFAYLSPAERVVITVIVAVLGFTPMAAGWIARESVFAGTEAEQLWQISLGGPDAENAVRQFKALDASGKSDLPMLFDLALEAKRSGRYDEALAYLRRAQILRPNAADVMNNLGNVLLMKGDLDGAKDAYLKATELAPDNALMQWNLSQVSTRRAQLGSKEAAEDIERSKTAIAAVYRLDRSIADHPKDYRANHFVLDVTLPESPGLPEATHVQADVEGQVRTWMMGAIAPELGMVIPLLMVLFLWGLAMGFRAVQISSECSRCGRPVCLRCDPDVRGGQLCGQCVFVFARKGVVDPPTRVRKESAARAYQERWTAARRTASIVLAGSGHLLAGHPLMGTLFLLGTLFFGALALFGQGIFRTPHASAWGFEGQVLASMVALVLWGLSIRSHRAAEGK